MAMALARADATDIRFTGGNDSSFLFGIRILEMRREMDVKTPGFRYDFSFQLPVHTFATSIGSTFPNVMEAL